MLLGGEVAPPTTPLPPFAGTPKGAEADGNDLAVYLVREGTRRLLEDVVAAVGTAEELLDAVRRLGPNAVIADIRMPPGHHMEGIAAAHAIGEHHPDVRRRRALAARR